MTVLPYVTEFGLQPEPDADFITDAVDPDAIPPQALGVDIATDVLGIDLLLTPDFDLSFCNESRALSQWVQNALVTRRGDELSLPEDFGSTLSDIIGSSPAGPAGVEEQIYIALEEAILYHDRVDSVSNVRIEFIDDYRLAFEATVILDDNAVLTFGGGTTIG
jgi:phage baseplate assembly protein W